MLIHNVNRTYEISAQRCFSFSLQTLLSIRCETFLGWFLLCAHFFLFQGTAYIPCLFRTKLWRKTFLTKSFPHALLWVHRTSLLMTIPLSHCIFTFFLFENSTSDFFRSAHMFMNSGCFGQFYYLSNALNLHYVNNNSSRQLCMDFLLSSKNIVE